MAAWLVAHILTLILFIPVFCASWIQLSLDLFVRPPNSMIARYFHPLSICAVLLIVIRLIDPVGLDDIYPYTFILVISNATGCLLLWCWLIATFVYLGLILEVMKPKAKADFDNMWRRPTTIVGVLLIISGSVFALLSGMLTQVWPWTAFLWLIFLYTIVAGVLTLYQFLLLYRIVRETIDKSRALAVADKKAERAVHRLHTLTILFCLSVFLLILGLLSNLAKKEYYENRAVPHPTSSASPFEFDQYLFIWVHILATSLITWLAWLPLHAAKTSGAEQSAGSSPSASATTLPLPAPSLPHFTLSCETLPTQHSTPIQKTSHDGSRDRLTVDPPDSRADLRVLDSPSADPLDSPRGSHFPRHDLSESPRYEEQQVHKGREFEIGTAQAHPDGSDYFVA